MRYDKLSPGLLSMVQGIEHEVGPQFDLRSGVMAVDRPRRIKIEPKFRAFLRCDPGVHSGRWDHLGVIASHHGLAILSASVPISAISQLSEDDVITQIVAGQQLHPRLDNATAATRLPDFVRTRGLTGKGVVVGIVDTGLDASHSAFAGRVSAVWDQTVQGPGVPEGAYGVLHLGPDVMNSTDEHGHGTHVASIAAGSDHVYPGVAPGADLVVVKTTFENTQIADAADFIFRVAGDRPAVVNLSLGGHNDAHDGTDPLSEILDSLTGPRRIICAAAGNEGGDDIHAEIDLTSVQTPIDVLIPPHVPVALINIWHGPNDHFSLAVRSPAGDVARVDVPLPEPFIQRTLLSDGEVRFSGPPTDHANGDRNLVIELLPPRFPFFVHDGAWQLSFQGVADENFHLWVTDRDELVRLSGSSVGEGYKVGSPGSATNAITVGAFVTRTEWNDAAGILQSTGLQLNDLAPFSSPGPLRSGGRKPDLAAPGSMLIAARSDGADPPGFLLIDETHTAMQGTSMSTPFVTGLVALLLEQDQGLDPEGARATLTAACVLPVGEPQPWTPRWGAGAIDAGIL